jgi:hypothetical protein
MNSINGVGASPSYIVGNVEARSSANLDATTQQRQTELTPTLTVQLDKITQEPIPPRFPWLSRLSAELEAAAKQRPTFPPTSAVGNNINKIA